MDRDHLFSAIAIVSSLVQFPIWVELNIVYHPTHMLPLIKWGIKDLWMFLNE
jgi:hypothetical protein